jgi:hypothetical protein
MSGVGAGRRREPPDATVAVYFDLAVWLQGLLDREPRITLDDLAAMLPSERARGGHVSTGTVSRWLNGKKPAPGQLIAAILAERCRGLPRHEQLMLESRAKELQGAVRQWERAQRIEVAYAGQLLAAHTAGAPPGARPGLPPAVRQRLELAENAARATREDAGQVRQLNKDLYRELDRVNSALDKAINERDGLRQDLTTARSKIADLQLSAIESAVATTAAPASGEVVVKDVFDEEHHRVVAARDELQQLRTTIETEERAASQRRKQLYDDAVRRQGLTQAELEKLEAAQRTVRVELESLDRQRTVLTGEISHLTAQLDQLQQQMNTLERPSPYPTTYPALDRGYTPAYDWDADQGSEGYRGSEYSYPAYPADDYHDEYGYSRYDSSPYDLDPYRPRSSGPAYDTGPHVSSDGNEGYYFDTGLIDVRQFGYESAAEPTARDSGEGMTAQNSATGSGRHRRVR